MTVGAIITLLVAVAFAGLLTWVLLPRNRRRLERHGKIPLDDDSPEGR
jgi:cbb3-type cytochrome oxidase subunit 3